MTMITCIDNIEWEDFSDNKFHINRVGDNELSHQSRTTANPTSSATRWREKTPRHRRQEYSHKNWSTSPGMTSRYGHRRVGDRERHNSKQNYWENPLHSHREVRQPEYSQSNCSKRWHRALHRQNGMEHREERMEHRNGRMENRHRRDNSAPPRLWKIKEEQQEPQHQAVEQGDLRQLHEETTTPLESI